MIHWFIILLISGVGLVCAELFIPGGVLGLMGGLALLGAMVIVFFEESFKGQEAIVVMGVMGVTFLSFLLWLRVFPRSRVGKALASSEDLSAANATEDGLDALLEQEGPAMSDLRPAGYARISGQRVDVVTRGEMIEEGKTVRVIEVEGNRIVVKQIETAIS